MKKKLFIIGADSTALEIKFVAKKLNYKVIYLVDKNMADDKLILSELELDSYLDNESDLIFGIANIEIKNKILNVINRCEFKRVNIISRKSHLFDNIKIGNGNFIANGAILSNNCKIGDDCILNFNSIVGHDTQIGNNVVINPGAVIAGNVQIGDNCIIGANSFIYQGLKIGNNVKIDAMTHIFRDIEDNKICTSRNLKVFENRNL